MIMMVIFPFFPIFPIASKHPATVLASWSPARAAAGRAGADDPAAVLKFAAMEFARSPPVPNCPPINTKDSRDRHGSTHQGKPMTSVAPPLIEPVLHGRLSRSPRKTRLMHAPHPRPRRVTPAHTPKCWLTALAFIRGRPTPTPLERYARGDSGGGPNLRGERRRTMATESARAGPSPMG